MEIIIANGLEPLDLCLYRHSYPTSMVESVMMLEANRHLAFCAGILPRNTEINIPVQTVFTKEITQLWD